MVCMVCMVVSMARLAGYVPLQMVNALIECNLADKEEIERSVRLNCHKGSAKRVSQRYTNDLLSSLSSFSSLSSPL